MNLWIINHYAGNFSYGMEYRHFLLCRHLCKIGIKPHIISASYHHLYTNPPEVSEELSFEEHDGIPFCIVKTKEYEGNGFGRLKNTIAFSRKLNKSLHAIADHFGKPDIALGSTPHPFVFLNLAKLKKTYGIPTIIEVRDLWPLMLFELGSLSKWNPLAWVFSWLEKQAFQRTDLTLSLWHTADNYMFKHGLAPEKYAYLPNGIELSEVNGTVPLDEKPLLDDVADLKAVGKFIVGYGGSHGFANPLDAIISACAELQRRGNNQIIFYLVGEGPEKHRIVEKAKELQLSNIRFHDYVSKATIMEFLAAIDVAFIGLKDLPLFKYGPTPNKLMDYMAAGCPIIYAIRSSFDPVAAEGLGISIAPDDGEALAEAIIELRGTPIETRSAMGRRARAFAEREHSYSALAERFDDIIRKIL